MHSVRASVSFCLWIWGALSFNQDEDWLDIPGLFCSLLLFTGTNATSLKESPSSLFFYNKDMCTVNSAFQHFISLAAWYKVGLQKCLGAQLQMVPNFKVTNPKKNEQIFCMSLQLKRSYILEIIICYPIKRSHSILS